MTHENYPKCRTCFHCLPLSPTKGQCQRVDGFCEETEPARLYCSEWGGNLLILMHPDKFGCSLHSELETDQQKGEG